jgi:hypothetical protein
MFTKATGIACRILAAIAQEQGHPFALLIERVNSMIHPSPRLAKPARMRPFLTGLKRRVYGSGAVRRRSIVRSNLIFIFVSPLYGNQVPELLIHWHAGLPSIGD